MVKKQRKIFKKLSMADTELRNEQMYKKFVKLAAKGKYGRMELYQLLADEFDIEERNSVGAIIRKMESIKNN